MNGLFLKYESASGAHVEIKLRSYMFDGGYKNVLVDNEKYKNKDGMLYSKKCMCGANDWSDNGRSINEYECNCCGQFIEAVEEL